MITKADQPRLNFDYALQEWHLITPVVMAAPQLALAVTYCREQYRKRILGEGRPERRRQMQEAVDKLTAATVKQFVIGSGEKVLYHHGKL